MWRDNAARDMPSRPAARAMLFTPATHAKKRSQRRSGCQSWLTGVGLTLGQGYAVSFTLSIALRSPILFVHNPGLVVSSPMNKSTPGSGYAVTSHWQVHEARDAVLREVHSRPFQHMTPPARVNHLVFVVASDELHHASRQHVNDLAQSLGAERIPDDVNYSQLRVDGTRIRWEKHTEFISYTFWSEVDTASNNDDPAWTGIDPQWLQAIPGKLLSSTRVELIQGDNDAVRAVAEQRIGQPTLIGSRVAYGDISLYGNFSADSNGVVHYVMGAEPGVTASRVGRYVQRVLEIETYRLMALIGLSHARRASVMLEEAEGKLAVLSRGLDDIQREDESKVLDQITALATRVEAIYASSYTRFSASSAYYQLVQARVEELSEQEVANLQTVAQFLARRLTPAMQTCSWTNRRLDDLSRRIGYVSELLDTRVSLEQAHDQNELLQTINKRQGAQLLLQSTVEGLSVAAITYYGSGIVSHLAKAMVRYGWPLPVELTVAASVPVIALTTWLGLRRLHRYVDDVIHPR